MHHAAFAALGVRYKLREGYYSSMAISGLGQALRARTGASVALVVIASAVLAAVPLATTLARRKRLA